MQQKSLEEVDPVSTQREVYTISRLNQEARGILEGNFPLIWVEGEISNLARPSSGHLYFSLKDATAQVRCAMFRSRNKLGRFSPDNGMQVIVRARVSLYEPRGDFQLIVEHMEEAGDGALRGDDLRFRADGFRKYLHRGACFGSRGTGIRIFQYYF